MSCSPSALRGVLGCRATAGLDGPHRDRTRSHGVPQDRQRPPDCCWASPALLSQQVGEGEEAGLTGEEGAESPD